MTTTPDMTQPGRMGPDTGREPSTASLAAGAMLVLSGSLSILMGVSGIAQDNLFASSDYVYGFSVTSWGVIHLIVGVALFLVGVAVLMHRSEARGAGIMIAGVSLITQFMFIPYYPWWAIPVMVLDLLIVFTLTRTFYADL